MLGTDLALLIKPSHIAEPEGPTTRIYNYVLGGFGERKKKKKEDWQRVLAQVPVFKKKKEKSRRQLQHEIFLTSLASKAETLFKIPQPLFANNHFLK